MKKIFESPEIFEAYGIIDACYYCLKLINDELKPVSPIHKMIDQASGYTKAITKIQIEESISLLEQIIESKKIIEADYSNNLKAIEALKNISTTN